MTQACGHDISLHTFSLGMTYRHGDIALALVPRLETTPCSSQDRVSAGMLPS